MPQTFLKEENIDYIQNFYRHKLYNKKDKQYLITTDDGNFLFLNSSAFIQLKRGKISDENTYNKLTQKGIIITHNNITQIINKTKQRYSFLKNKTSLHIVIPTHRCNLSCIYCFASSCPITAQKSKTDMNEKTAIKTIEFIMKSPSDAITIEFQGGEPTARFDIIQLMVRTAKKLNDKYKKDLRFALVSNFTLLTKEKVEWLIQNDVTFCTSLDGPKIVHDKNRFLHTSNNKQVGTYDTVIKWINKINEIYKQKNIPLQANALITITKHSLPYYKEIIDEYIKLKLNIINLRPLTIAGKAIQTKNNINYSYNEFETFYKNSLDYIKKLKQKGIQIDERIELLFLQKIIQNTPGYHTEYESPCGAATGQIVYHTDGNIYTCNEALGQEEFKLGNIFEDKWHEIFKKKETAKAILNSMLESNVMCDRCIYKPYCSTCMVENFNQLNKFHFHPSKSKKHYETIFNSENIFNEIIKFK